MMNKIALLSVLAIATAVPLAPTQNIVELAIATPELSTLVTALKAADLVSTLEGPGPFTVFAPTNEAFAAISPDVLKKLLDPANKALLTSILTYHAATGNVQAADLKDNEKITTVNGDDVTALVKSTGVFIEGGLPSDVAQVIKADVEATNGVVHVINQILIPPASEFASEVAPPSKTIVQLALETPVLSTLVTALKAADLVGALNGTGPFTVFAPTNTAFAKLPSGVLDHLLKPENKAELVKVLTYHVASGNVQAADLKNDEKIKTLEGDDVTAKVVSQGVFIEGGQERDFAKVIEADVEASNGVVHLIDAILLPPSAPGPAPPAPPSPGKKTIVELALETPELSTLVTALKAADLVGALNGTGPFTVFAPTNDAFARLPADDLKKLLEPENKALLVKVLTYHVASGNVQAADLKNDEHIKTLEGEDVTAFITPDGVFIADGERDNYGRVIKADVEASNGVVHVIDHVLIPPPHQDAAQQL